MLHRPEGMGGPRRQYYHSIMARMNRTDLARDAGSAGCVPATSSLQPSCCCRGVVVIGVGRGRRLLGCFLLLLFLSVQTSLVV